MLNDLSQLQAAPSTSLQTHLLRQTFHWANDPEWPLLLKQFLQEADPGFSIRAPGSAAEASNSGRYNCCW